MNNNVGNIRIRNIAISIVGLILLLISFNLYKDNKTKVFMDEYMDDIFVEESVSTISDNYEETENILQIEEKEKTTILIEIKGEVKRPDVYEMDEGSIVRDLIEKAGGLTDEANIDKINRAAKLMSNQLIIIPNKNSVEESITVETIYNGNEGEIININTASIEELTKINGIGEVRAKRIIEYREENSGFKSIEEIKNIEGIGEKTFEKLKDSITI
jgi:competence protein ComEA